MPPPTPPPPATIHQCQQLLLARLKSGQQVLASADKEGYRTLCYYRQTFLLVAVGDEGTSLLRMPTDDHLLGHLWRQSNGKIIMANNQSQWTYELTDAEKLERWQAQLGRLAAFGDSQRQFVSRVVAEFAALAAE